MPVTGMTAPESAAVEESGATEKSEPRPIEAIGRPDGDAEANWRTVYRPRWRRIVVTWRGCALRFNHIGTGVRARSSSKRECEHRQCYQYKFFCHVDFPCVVWRIEPSDECEVAKENDGRANYSKVERKTTQGGEQLLATRGTFCAAL
jgi:hypothetical protein